MWRITAVLACACAALSLAGGASSTTFGVADDTGKYSEDGGASFFHMLTDLGMTENRMAVFWDPSKPDTIFDQAFFDRALPNAMRHGIEVVFAIYPEKARSLVDTPNGVELFAQYAAKVVERDPSAITVRNPDNTKARRVLGWAPLVAINDGLATLQPGVR